MRICKVARKSHQRALARRVDALAGFPAVGVHRADVQNTTATLLAKVRNRRANEKEWRLQVDVDGPVESSVIGIFDSPARLHRGIIDKTVDPSKMSYRLFNEPGGNRGVLKVTDHKRRILS